jgi:FkbM family methyltransferase
MFTYRQVVAARDKVRTWWRSSRLTVTGRGLKSRLVSRVVASTGLEAGSVGPGAHALRVQAVQKLVNRATTHKVVVDGIYGEKTIAGVAFLQRRLRLPSDGFADPLTLVLAQGRINAQTGRKGVLRQFLLELPSSKATEQQHILVRAEPHLYIPRVLEERGLCGYEPETIAAWLAALQTLPPGPVFDIGANVGVFSLMAAARTNREVVAFEPTPDLAATNRRIAVENNLRVTVEQLALGRETGGAMLHLSSVSDASNSLAAGFRPSRESLPVRVETLAGYCERTARAPVLLKVDTETTEADVLAGGLSFIKEHRPWIVCELLPGHREQEVPELLRRLDYRYLHLTPSFPQKEHDSPRGENANRNWLLAPSSPPEMYWKTARTWYERLLRCGPASATPG